jgi:release factor glutamine methyltransferase
MGEVLFYGRALEARPGRVMTPRTTTERLVRRALRELGTGPARVADVGTGSGAIAVAFASAAPDAEVWATDTSPEAVALARANVFRHGLADRVHVRCGDLLEPVPGPIDLVLANLPYLPAAERGCYPDIASEPDAAVFAAGDGLGPYRRLLEQCADLLTPDGAVVIQLRGDVLTATRSELPLLRVGLDERLAAAA